MVDIYENHMLEVSFTVSQNKYKDIAWSENYTQDDF